MTTCKTTSTGETRVSWGSNASSDTLVPIEAFANVAKGEKYGFGWCHLEAYKENVTRGVELGMGPTLKKFLNTPDVVDDDDEFGSWAYRLPEQEQVNMSWEPPISFGAELKVSDEFSVLHAVASDTGMEYSDYLTVGRLYNSASVVGARLSELVEKAGDLEKAAEDYAVGVLNRTSDLNADAADNYARMGDYMEEIHERGGFREISRGKFVTVTQGLISRWASSRESVAAARLAAELVYNDKEEFWSPSIFEDAMEAEEDDVDKQARLLRMAGLAFKKGVSDRLEERRRRGIFARWKADALAPAKAFCRAVGIEDEEVDSAAERGIKAAVPMVAWAAGKLREHSVPAVKVMGKLAVGGAVTAALVAAAGILMDWYYVDKAMKKLGPNRKSETWGVDQMNYVNRAKELFALGAALSDDAYDCSTHTQAFRIDPFFFSIRSDLSRMKDDTAANRMLTNALIPPLIQSISTTNKTVVSVPGTVSEESAMHIQKAMPEFYFRVVNRSHSHPELWTVRRGFEIIVSRALVTGDATKNVVMIGGNVRQVSKIPSVVANYGPVLTGRDDARHTLKGTAQQRDFFRTVNVPEKFGTKPKLFPKTAAVSFYSAQDISKEEYIRAAIACGLQKHYIALNIPVIMMDDRVSTWDDTILNCRYERKRNVLTMTPLALPVAGYDNDFSKVMSWVRPHKPFLGYDVTMSALTQVGSSYLFEMDIGCGPQEAYSTIWRMPDAGYYVLHDLTRDLGTMRYYTVPAAKFDQVVKFVVQLNGAKNVIEAVAGRIMGLEAQIKIGGVVLERAWHMTHREFSSTMIHALMCAGLDKGDTVHMLGRLRTHFSDPALKTFGERVVSGYKKLIGIDKDIRQPTKAARGASDYDPVTHWTSVQPPGVGFSIAFQGDETGKRPSGEADDAKEKLKHRVKKRKTVASNIPKDEGYSSFEELNAEDLGEDLEEGEKPSETFVEKLTKIFRPSESNPDATAGFGGFRPDFATRQLVIDPDEMSRVMTKAAFNPDGVPEYGSDGGSLGNAEFCRTCASDSDVLKAFEEQREVMLPDRGGAHVVNLAFGRSRETTNMAVGLHRWVGTTVGTSPMEKLESEFFSEVDDGPISVPQLVLDGIAASAKSSVVRTFIRTYGISAAVVCPTRKLARDWREHKVGACVTKHKLRKSTLRGRALLVIDEAYAYTKAELHGLLNKAAQVGVKTVLLGDRQQQYEDGGEITVSDMRTLGAPMIRLVVSNNMPVDALIIAKWAASTDPLVSFFQTRSPLVHSIMMRQKDQLQDRHELLEARKAGNCLVFKDRLGPELQYETITDVELGFEPGKEEDWLSTSRTQGLRTDHSLLLTSRFTKAMKWFSEQPGLFYVATSRHSKTMLCLVDQYDLSLLDGLTFENQVTVEGRLAILEQREKFHAPMIVLDAKIPKKSTILDKLAERGSIPQTVKFRSMGPVLEDWRPWHRFTRFGMETAPDLMRVAALRLVGDEVPYTQTGAVKQPTYQNAMGLHSIRRPETFDPSPLDCIFPGIDRLAVPQNSRDELLDQKNVIERTARPRVISDDNMAIKIHSERLFSLFKKCLLLREGERPLSVDSAATDWANTRTPEFAAKIAQSDPYGLTAFSVRSAGFLKTQIKVKLSRNFATQENYGQTVLASPADFNAIFGPWSKMLLRNLRLSCRPGVIFDTGYSDKELARELRQLGALPKFELENYQADVKRQDTSHTPVTLRVFVMLMAEMGVPEDLCQLYEQHSSQYEYASMHSGLYRGNARYNLGSGDPFTLIRNIVELFTVMLERFGDQLENSTMVAKGDDFLSDKIFSLLPTTVPEVRATQLTEAFNAPPYHAGRFFLEDNIVPDPVRMVAKILVKRTDDLDRVNQLAESFYDRYVPLTGYSYNKLSHYVREAYADFEPELSISSLELYHAMRDRNLFFELLCSETSDDAKKLVVLDYENLCASRATAHFSSDPEFLRSLENEPLAVVQQLLNVNHIPNFEVKGKPNDFLKRGVWLTGDHAWAVIGLTEYKEKETAHSDADHTDL